MIGDKIVKILNAPVVEQIYNDGVKQIVVPIGDTISLLPRAIHAALHPLEKWILEREHSLDETEKMLIEKLEKCNPESIVSPDAHIAVPALQYIGYCMDNNELRTMYANLLANSMVNFTKSGVHPAFVELIKQLSPDEAKILRYIYGKRKIPILSVRHTNEKGVGKSVLVNFSDVGFSVGCEKPEDVRKYFDNLMRLGLINKSDKGRKLANNRKYDELIHHPIVVNISKLSDDEMSAGMNSVKYYRRYMEITEFGRSFCSICLDEPFKNINNDSNLTGVAQ